MNIKRLFPALIDLIYPRRCPVCDQIVVAPEVLIHAKCLAKLSFVKQPACKCCGKEVLSEAVEYCYDCTRHRRSFDAGGALLNYNEIARHSMAAVKYKNRREYLDFYGEAIALRFQKRVAFWQPEVLIPIPVHSSRRRRRGFNQAEELAMRLSKRWGIPVETGILIRNKKTMPQRGLNPKERLENLTAAFGVSNSRRNVPESVLLVDDIYTTGSTMEACARALKAAGVKRIYYLAICVGSPA